VEAPLHLVGRTVANLAIPGEIMVAALTREGRALLPTLGTQFRAGDVLHLVVLAAAMPRLEALLDWSSSGGG
jgi:trk system potassium uptake protein TrkA